ncbi:MAG: (2Fe-2S) ferredoxin domain-containing protein [Methylophilales bacterium]|nr:(2Fe-2S) ferredoxin domain-containing protein [Methylophilales bacterium]
MNPSKTIIVCINHRANPDVPSCGARGGEAIAQCIESVIAAHALVVGVERFKCLGMCDLGPNIKLSPSGNFYHHVSLEGLPELVQQLSTD